MVISPLGAVLGPVQVASAQESSESTPVADQGSQPGANEGGVTPSQDDATPTVEDPTPEPTVEPTVEPTAQPTEVPATPEGEDPIELTDTTLDQIVITSYCYRSPEMTRVDNTGDTAITILSINAVLDGTDGTLNVPVPGTETIEAGATKIYRSGPAALTGTVLTTTSLFTSTTAVVIGVKIVTNIGIVEKDCGVNPNLQLTVPADVTITLDCLSNPETARIFNGGSAAIVITSVESLDGDPSGVTVNRTLGPGKTVIYRSNTGATSGTVLIPIEFYNDEAYENDGIRLNTSIGTIDKACAAKPPTYPSLLEITIDCKNVPEWVKIKNVGLGAVTITGLESLYQKKPIEPFTLNKTLQPGQGVIYRSGTTGAYANVLTSQYLYNPNVGSAEGARIFTKTGKTFVVRCPDVPRIEVNLTTQTLYAWEGNTLIRTSPVTTGKDGFLTPTGRFHIMTKEGTIRMAACSGGECWDVPNVPHSMLFLQGGYYLHGAYWHNNFGNPALRSSHGCVNLPLEFAGWLFDWARIGTEVWIHY